MSSLQATKSENTRRAILDSAVECFIDLGYKHTTTALIAEHAGVSRGAMMHHFPSRASVLRASIEHIHQQRLSEYRELMSGIGDLDYKVSRELIERSIRMAWQYVNLPSSIAFMEVVVAARTVPELREVLQPLVEEYESNFLELVRVVFPHWDSNELMETANDLVHFPLTGMMSSQLRHFSPERIDNILRALADSIEMVYRHAGYCT